MGHYLSVSRWRPNFRPSLETVSKTLIWVLFSDLPLELFNEEIVSMMGDSIGQTICIDNTTMSAIRDRYARACVEVDLGDLLLPTMDILERTQAVEYEGLHLICFKCRRYGHKGDSCPSLSSAHLDRTIPLTHEADKQYTLEDPFGPWMFPKQFCRKPHQKPKYPVRQQPPTVHPNAGATEDKEEWVCPKPNSNDTPTKGKGTN